MRPDLTALSLDMAATAESKGFITPSSISFFSDVEVTNADIMLGKLMWIVTEVAEARDEVNGERPWLFTETGQQRFVQELADITIRGLAIFGAMSVDAEHWIFMAGFSPLSSDMPLDTLLMEMVVLVSRTAKAIRKGDQQAFLRNLAAVVGMPARIAAFWGLADEDAFWDIVVAKAEFNKTRPAKHGHFSRI